MKIRRTVPEPPPAFHMEFTRDEGWALVMALNDAFKNYEKAADRETWRKWAADLDRQLRL